jgi:hypothetical protein
VQNRVDEIWNVVPISCWNHCAGKDNPADFPSRGLTTLELSVWRSGPNWLETTFNPMSYVWVTTWRDSRILYPWDESCGLNGDTQPVEHRWADCCG